MTRYFGADNTSNVIESWQKENITLDATFGIRYIKDVKNYINHTINIESTGVCTVGVYGSISQNYPSDLNDLINTNGGIGTEYDHLTAYSMTTSDNRVVAYIDKAYSYLVIASGGNGRLTISGLSKNN